MKFSDGIGYKKRPVVILNNNRGDFLICAISTQLQQGGQFDIYLNCDSENNLRKDSVILLFKISTISSESITTKMGKLSKNNWILLKNNMQKFVNSW
ncbi:MAG TPA: type II toxin-antitoxin system PemK/MazF family toxin [Candidatus Absconditabacterales bacterium]|nr:type II toxin-antitoxin system PemK/MazF family toxin [Candidatus Absconditabacterales bacterium]